MIIYGDDTGVKQSFATPATGLRIKIDARPTEFGLRGEDAKLFRNRELIWAGMSA